MLYIEIIFGSQVMPMGHHDFNKLEDLKDNKMTFYLKDIMAYCIYEVPMKATPRYLRSHNVGW